VVNNVSISRSDEVVKVFHGGGRSIAAPMSVLAIIACIVCAIAAVCLAVMTYLGLALVGFPDGHVTDYEKAIEAPLTILAWVEAGFGVLFLALAFSTIRERAVGLLVTLIAFVLVAIVARFGVPWYFGTHLGLDNGIGG
jgi:hypothetical protein